MAAIRTKKVVIVQLSTSLQSNESDMEIYNHADTTLLGSNCLPINYFGRSVDVSGWDTSAGIVEFPTISGAISYDHPTSRQFYMLVYYQDIHCPRLTSHLMCPIHSWMAGVIINEIPKFLAEDPYKKTHSIIVDDPLNPNEPLVILLALKWVTIYFPSRKLRVIEYEDETIPHINITREAPVWDPSETSFAEQEDVITDFRGEVINNETIIRVRRIINSLSAS